MVLLRRESSWDNFKNKHLIKYPNLRLTIRLVPYSTEIAVSELKGFFSDMLDPHQPSKNLFLIP